MSSETGGAQNSRKRRKRGSITIEEIVDGAYALADEVTIANVSVPVLARRLGVGVSSIYWYFHSKEELLDVMRARALEQYEIALPFNGAAGEWDDLLREHFRTMRTLFRDNPVLCDLIIMQTLGYGDLPNRLTFQRLESIIATLVAAGFTPDDALRTYYSLATHSRGFAMLERSRNIDTQTRQRAHITPPIDRETMPNLTRLAENGHTFGLLQDHVFEAGLDALINHARALLESTTSNPEMVYLRRAR